MILVFGLGDKKYNRDRELERVFLYKSNNGSVILIRYFFNNKRGDINHAPDITTHISSRLDLHSLTGKLDLKRKRTESTIFKAHFPYFPMMKTI
jgi:hypothetical protein